MLLQSLDRGDTWIELSPDLTTNDSVKIAGKGHMMYCTITTISESPVKAGVIWVGTDDGRVHVTPDFGKTWIEVTDTLVSLGAPADCWVTRVFASNFSDSTAYVCKSGFKFDDFKPYVFKTTDMGKTWTDISEGLPEYPVNVIIRMPIIRICCLRETIWAFISRWTAGKAGNGWKGISPMSRLMTLLSIPAKMT